VFHAGLAEPPVLLVATAAGLRAVRVVGAPDGAVARMSVEMGQAKVVGAEPERAVGDVRRATRVDVGNPHVVLEWRGTALPARDQLIAIGAAIDAATPGGANVEVIRPGATADSIDMVVYERGVGPTRACGTGACAVVAAAHEWGICGPTATVRMPGGPVEIALGDPVLLTGDVTSVAAIEVPWP
jgi:diaminopimelate epimerase